MASFKLMDGSVGKPFNIQIEKLNGNVLYLVEAFRELSAKVSAKPLASDVAKSNFRGAVNRTSASSEEQAI